MAPPTEYSPPPVVLESPNTDEELFLVAHVVGVGHRRQFWTEPTALAHKPDSSLCSYGIVEAIAFSPQPAESGS